MRFLTPDPAGAEAVDPSDPQTWNQYAYVRNNPLNATDPTGYCDVAIYGITMNPGDSSSVDNFSADKVAVFPFEGTNLATGIGEVIAGGGDVEAAVEGIQSAIAQTPSTQSVNIFAFSGGAETLASAWTSLSPAEQGRIGNITYAIPGTFTGALSWSGSLPRGSNDPTVIFPAGNGEIPGGVPTGSYNVHWALGCLHDVNCVLTTQNRFLKKRGGPPCAKPTVLPKKKSDAPGRVGTGPGAVTGGPDEGGLIYWQPAPGPEGGSAGSWIVWPFGSLPGHMSVY